MQTKLFVFFAFLAFCHVSYCDTVATTEPAAPSDDVKKMLEQLQQGYTSTLDTIRGSLEQVFKADAILNITNSIIKNTSLNAQQVQEIVQKTFQMLQENVQSTFNSVKLPKFEFGGEIMQPAETFSTILKNVFSFSKTFGTNNQPAAAAPALPKE
ncbi:uncharacterized protein [Chelonus insularis]|uniref:uncharacterized protein n=1 Tax=Chelonus insularis TaxID=460826 RepID=UPI00158DE756|nr:uncharacterized protein LOC118066473 [Chelonus insularis]